MDLQRYVQIFETGGHRVGQQGATRVDTGVFERYFFDHQPASLHFVA